MARVVEEEESMLQGQADIVQYIYNFVESMALKCAVELGIADIINSYGHPTTLSQIASHVASPSIDMDRLSRVMRLLVRKKVFTATIDTQNGDTLYGLTNSSKWLLHDDGLSLAPLVLMVNHPNLLASWQFLSKCVIEGGSSGFEMVHGLDLYNFQSKDHEFKKFFVEGMACTSRIAMKAILTYYKDEFNGVGSIVDVGGGNGTSVAEIVKAHPHIRGINLDLPHIVATALECPGVTHVGGNMFTAVPHADAIFMKWIMHNWSDKDCVQILNNCRKAISEKNGKVIIVDAVLQPQGDGLFDNVALRYDLSMMVQTSSGKERTEVEWKNLLNEGGFASYKIIELPSFVSIIEAYPN